MKFLIVLGCAISMLLSACSPAEPVKIGFLGGLSGRVADLGQAGRSGALMAVEEANAGSGVNGRKVQLVVQDDAQNPEIAVKAVAALAEAKVVAIIGPMTSSIAEVILPAITSAGIVTISPTVTGSALIGKDDFLFRVAPSIAENTRVNSGYLFAKGGRKLAIAYDLSNRAYTADWVEHYRKDFSVLGGIVVAEASFNSGEDVSYVDVIKSIEIAQPDSFLFVANAVDTVRLTQVVRNLGLMQPVMASTWAATENLTELGGRTVEGLAFTQFFNRDDKSPRYTAFAEAFRKRFKQEPGFASVAAYDATKATLNALNHDARSGKALKELLIASGPYDGLQQQWSFDRYGDAQRSTFVAVVRDGHFVNVN